MTPEPGANGAHPICNKEDEWRAVRHDISRIKRRQSKTALSSVKTEQALQAVAHELQSVSEGVSEIRAIAMGSGGHMNDSLVLRVAALEQSQMHSSEGVSFTRSILIALCSGGAVALAAHLIR